MKILSNKKYNELMIDVKTLEEFFRLTPKILEDFEYLKKIIRSQIRSYDELASRHFELILCLENQFPEVLEDL